VVEPPSPVPDDETDTTEVSRRLSVSTAPIVVMLSVALKRGPDMPREPTEREGRAIEARL
jgi:hypothetical protein